MAAKVNGFLTLSYQTIESIGNLTIIAANANDDEKRAGRSSVNIVFLHPPSLYDFRKHPVFLGPISEAVPSSPVFEMYPMGFFSMMRCLEHRGHRVRIVNLALKMLNNRRFDAEKLISRVTADLFCIDLHWLAHAQGALEVAKICKQHHPRVPVVLGGMTATYYHDEILREFNSVDFVLKGDSCELPLAKLVADLDKEDKSGIPNLSWRDHGAIVSNPISHVPDRFEIIIDPRPVVKAMIRDRDLEAYLPYKLWAESPIVPVLTSRGCRHNCAVCGGSSFSYARYMNRTKPAFMAIDAVVAQVKIARKYFGAPVFFLNDIRMAGEGYYRELFKKIRESEVSVPAVFELFSPLTEEFARELSATFTHYNLEMSPEDASEEVRAGMGKRYTSGDVVKSIEIALKHGCDKFDLFFMIGLAGQSRKHVDRTLEFIDSVLSRFRHARGRIFPFVSAYAPTIDPGSLAFEQSEKYGYRILRRTLAEQRKAFESLSWKKFFNYETRVMTTGEIVDTTFLAVVKLAEIKEKHGLIRREETEILKRKVKLSREVMKRLEGIDQVADSDERQAILADLREDTEVLLKSFIKKKVELNWPHKFNAPYLFLFRLLGRICRFF